MLNSGKKREDKNEAGLGMRQAGEELLLALPSLAFTGRPRQGLRPWGSGWRGWGGGNPPILSALHSSWETLRIAKAILAHRGTSLVSARVPDLNPTCLALLRGGGTEPARVRVQESAGPQLYQQGTDQG